MESVLHRYLDRYAYQKRLFSEEPPDNLAITVVIPAYDEPGILDTLTSLAACTVPDCAVEVLVIINHPEHAEEPVKVRNAATYDTIRAWLKTHVGGSLPVHVTRPIALPSKHAGVGLARKIGMDEAVRRFYRAGTHNGLIVNLDADCICTPNYLQALHETMLQHPDLNGCSIYFEHPLEDLEEPLLTHITQYELHLRYHRISLLRAHYPYAFHTVGSSMGVSARAYAAQGGMNKRKAGEDFYFLHKIFPLGGFYTLNNTAIFPKARLSDKVPFGTGAALSRLAEGAYPAGWTTYHPESYRLLGVFLTQLADFYDADNNHVPGIVHALPEGMRTYLEQHDTATNILRIKQTTKTLDTFTKAFFRWFDGLKVLRFLNHAARQDYPNLPVGQAAAELVAALREMHVDPSEEGELLRMLRVYDRQSN